MYKEKLMENTPLRCVHLLFFTFIIHIHNHDRDLLILQYNVVAQGHNIPQNGYFL